MFTPTAIFAKQAVAGEAFTIATGGSITTDGDYKIHTFTSDGTFTITQVGTLPYEVLVVAGGGGGGGRGGAGGGGGGLIHIPEVAGWTNFNLAQGYDIVVGAGGAGGVNGSGDRGSNGANSTISGTSFSTLTAVGGGGGGGYPSFSGNQNGADGGSGGGFSTYFTDGGTGVGEGTQTA